MARKKIVRRIPPLPKNGALRAKDHKGERLVEILRGIAVANQRDESQTFYPMREVAAGFRVPVSMVARVYAQLEDEGILSSIRGSKTILQGLSTTRHLSVRGVVGLPASLARFVTVQDYRTFFIRTRRELRLRDFATATIFFERSEENADRLVQRIKKYKVDTVLWFLPGIAAKDSALRLRDAGIRVLGIGDGSLSGIDCCYEVRRDAAVTAILQDWHSSSRIEHVTIVRATRSAAYSTPSEEQLELILERENLTCEVSSLGQQSVERFLESLARDESRGIIFLSSAASMFSFRSPETLRNLLTCFRVAFVGGPVSVPFAKAPDAEVDLVLVDWQLVAERIVNDLLTKKTFTTTKPVIFEAEPRIHVPLSQYAQSL